MTRGRADAPAAERGFVIVAVLWIIMALSALAVIFSLYLSASAQALALNDTALQTEALVSASLELTAYQLTLAGDKVRPSRGSFHFRMDDATFSSSSPPKLPASISISLPRKSWPVCSQGWALLEPPPRKTQTGSSDGAPVRCPVAPMTRKRSTLRRG